MLRSSLFLLLICGALGVGMVFVPARKAEKRVIGQTAHVEIAEAGLEFLGRVDTGAASTSVHAESVQLEGNTVSFYLLNRAGDRIKMQAPLAKTALVRNPEGSERRIYVELTLRHEGAEKQVLANLNDRSDLTYALLLGRNWLQDDYIVDVTREAVRPPEIHNDSRTLASR